MKTILILNTTLDGLRSEKDKLVSKLNDSGNLKSWGDDSVQTNDDVVYFLKVISLSDYVSKLMSLVGKGYDEIKLDPVIDEVQGLLQTLAPFKKEEPKETPNPSPEATESTESADEDEDDLDIANEEEITN